MRDTLPLNVLKAGIPPLKQGSCCFSRHDHFIYPFLGCSYEEDFEGIFNIADTWCIRGSIRIEQHSSGWYASRKHQEIFNQVCVFTRPASFKWKILV